MSGSARAARNEPKRACYHAGHRRASHRPGVNSMEMALHCRNHWDVVEGLRQCSRCGQTFCRDCLIDIGGRPYCATCKNEQLLDVRSGVTSAATLNLASLGRRFAALFLDGLIVGIPFGIVIGVILFSAMAGGRMRPEAILAVQPLSWLS